MRRALIVAVLLSFLSALVLWAAQSTQTQWAGPAGSVAFGARVAVLPNGNIVVTDPRGADDGAAYLYSPDHVLISKVTGVVPNFNSLASYEAVTIVVLKNGNYLLVNPMWGDGTTARLGMVAWGSATTGISGTISSANALVGNSTDDRIGDGSITVLANGNYVVGSRWFNNGTIERAGAVTWGNGSVGTHGVVTAANSLLGDRLLGSLGWPGTVVALANGNYVVNSSFADPVEERLASLTWGNGMTGVSGTIGPHNSLVGSHYDDQGFVVTPLANGNYVAAMPYWDNGATVNVGAVVWCNGATGRFGPVSTGNALVGTRAGNFVGHPQVVALTNGNYVVGSSDWEGPDAINRGAVTWADGATGLVGEVSPANSLVGGRDYQFIGEDPEYRHDGIVALANGNYVIASPWWSEGDKELQGAVTWGNGSTGTVGVVSAGNSLIGPNSGDKVGFGSMGIGIIPLDNGNYVVSNVAWHAGANGPAVGAWTWVNGSVRRVGQVTAANSLVGSSQDDGASSVTALRNGNYVVSMDGWNNGALENVGAVIWGNGTTGLTGTVSPANAVVGSAAYDFGGYPVALADGNYVICGRNIDNGAIDGAGAVRWGNGLGGTVGEYTAANSLRGTRTQDYLCADGLTAEGHIPGMTALPDGRYIVYSPDWDNGSEIWDAEAVTLGDGPVTGTINADNSVMGTVINGGDMSSNWPGLSFDYDLARQRLTVGRPASNVVTLMTLNAPSPPPRLSVADAWVTEGNSGSRNLVFTVTLSRPLANAVTFNVDTANGTAIAGGDYIALNLAGQSIPAGSTSKTFQVPVLGDTLTEIDETFSLNLSSVAGGATLVDGQAIGTINDNEAAVTPTLSINDVTVSEGNSGIKLATFTIGLSQASLRPVGFRVSTADGSAAAGSDYVAQIQLGQFAPGETSKTFSVVVKGDAASEQSEYFNVIVDDVTGALVAKSRALGTIGNDDFGTGARRARNDADADGKSDLLLQHAASGYTAFWTLSGAVPVR